MIIFFGCPLQWFQKDSRIQQFSIYSPYTTKKALNSLEKYMKFFYYSHFLKVQMKIALTNNESVVMFRNHAKIILISSKFCFFLLFTLPRKTCLDATITANVCVYVLVPIKIRYRSDSELQNTINISYQFHFKSRCHPNYLYKQCSEETCAQQGWIVKLWKDIEVNVPPSSYLAVRSIHKTGIFLWLSPISISTLNERKKLYKN